MLVYLTTIFFWHFRYLKQYNSTNTNVSFVTRYIFQKKTNVKHTSRRTGKVIMQIRRSWKSLSKQNRLRLSRTHCTQSKVKEHVQKLELSHEICRKVKMQKWRKQSCLFFFLIRTENQHVENISVLKTKRPSEDTACKVQVSWHNEISKGKRMTCGYQKYINVKFTSRGREKSEGDREGPPFGWLIPQMPATARTALD